MPVIDISMRSKYEIKAQKLLESDGYLVDWKVRPSFVGRGFPVDFFHLFDLIAVKENELRWIAIKGKEGVPSKLKNSIKKFQGLGSKEIWSVKKNTRGLKGYEIFNKQNCTR